MDIVYLAGPITGTSYKNSNNWRDYAVKELAKYGLKGISPMRFKNYLSDEESIKDNYDKEKEKSLLSGSRGITVRDRFDTFRCDVFLANLLGAEKISIGTMIEYGWADSNKKPIITIIEKEGNPHDHSMIRELTGFRVENLDEGLYIARATLSS